MLGLTSVVGSGNVLRKRGGGDGSQHCRNLGVHYFRDLGIYTAMEAVLLVATSSK